ncbi:MAG: hypothetical protein HY396_02190 [Candidatus Doudnabacteria bacterium]|nr:hypothetical protein [Candidatus Doudnabacteria bacterium]
MTFHKDLSQGRWFTLSLAEQLGNAGSELNRAISWKNRGDNSKFNAALERFFELMDLTLADPRWTGARRRELARVREQAGEELYRPGGPRLDLQKYFDQFVILARYKK